MGVRITEFQPQQAKAIKVAAKHEWPFTGWENDEDGLTAEGEGSLCCGEGEEEFTERLSLAVWKANGAYCSVLVTATFLEIEPPSEEHQLDENDYERLLAVPSGIL